MEFFLNTYLNYYELPKMENGHLKVFEFLSDWFIRKSMSDNNYISSEIYEDLC